MPDPAPTDREGDKQQSDGDSVNFSWNTPLADQAHHTDAGGDRDKRYVAPRVNGAERQCCRDDQ